ncbi:acyl-homoserine-lactone synthase [Poseidonocella sedimentorum]|uniref:Acyl-homoserine-lactone synthase n=1 Tax=Poseidonocella sedimentorum TaxID=871652 RepID=A0A1I6DRW9_9RHOB|nr:acyl-homoserine-lactone synthase [Poseidonocella sedimentorum]SFR08210.1 N-acyl-L-homoserine lactone synthetase [Poseidonocella sedimentorum]
MLRYIYASELDNYPLLRDTMFRDRANQFKDRLGWDVTVDENGFEKDQYDELNPLYVIWERADGRHGGSMRFLPTTGRTMVNEHFLHVTDGVEIRSGLIWECTRFCLAPGAEGNVAGALMLAGGEIMDRFSLDHFVGVFDARMIRIYTRIGAKPTVLGTDGEGREAISVGLWEFSKEAKELVAKRAGLTLALSDHWFRQAFERNVPQLAAIA